MTRQTGRRRAPVAQSEQHLLVFDLDGTLLNPDGTLPHLGSLLRSAEAAPALIDIAVATGRSPHDVAVLFDVPELRSRDLLVFAFDGAATTTVRDGRVQTVLGERSLEKRSCALAISFLRSVTLGSRLVLLFGTSAHDFDVYAHIEGDAFEQAAVVEKLCDGRSFQEVTRRELTEIAQTVELRSVSWFGQGNAVERDVGRLRDRASQIGVGCLLYPEARVPGDLMWLDLVHPTVNKGDALAVWKQQREAAGIRLRTIAFGNGPNDESLFHYADRAVSPRTCDLRAARLASVWDVECGSGLVNEVCRVLQSAEERAQWLM